MMVKVTNGAVGGQMNRPDPDAAGLDQDLESLDNIWRCLGLYHCQGEQEGDLDAELSERRT